MRIFFEINEYIDTLQQNLWGAAMFRGQFTALKPDIKKRKIISQ